MIKKEIYMKKVLFVFMFFLLVGCEESVSDSVSVPDVVEEVVEDDIVIDVPLDDSKEKEIQLQLLVNDIEISDLVTGMDMNLPLMIDDYHVTWE